MRSQTWQFLPVKSGDSLKHCSDMDIKNLCLCKLRSSARCDITGRRCTKALQAAITDYTFTSQHAVFRFYFYSKPREAVLSHDGSLRIVINTERYRRLVDSRIPGLFLWCLLNASGSCGVKAESSWVNHLWHIPAGSALILIIRSLLWRWGQSQIRQSSSGGSEFIHWCSTQSSTPSPVKGHSHNKN